MFDVSPGVRDRVRAIRPRLPPRLRELSRGAVTLLIALSVLNASNYIFHVAVSRLLGPEEYGGLAAVLAIVMILAVPLSVAQTVVAKRVAVLRRAGAEDDVDVTVAATTRSLARAGLVGFVLLTLASPLLAAFLRADLGPTLPLGLYWLVSLPLSAVLGGMQGRLRFAPLAGVAVFGVAVRLVAGIGLVWAGFGVTGAILGTVLAQVLSLLLALAIAPDVRSAWRRAKGTGSALRGEFRATLLALGSFWLLAEIDLVLARRFLEPGEAGLYASAGLLARAMLFLPAAISMVALPRFAESRDGEEARRRLRIAIAAVAGLLLVAAPVLLALRGWVVELAFGEQFRPAADLLPLLVAGASALALCHLLVFFHVAEGTRAYRLMLAGVAVEAVLIALFHDSAVQIGWIVLGTGLVTAALQYHAAVAACRWRRPLVPAAIEGDGSLDLSVVLPCHNAGPNLREVLDSLIEELRTVGSAEIIVVSDGSTDATAAIANEFSDRRVTLIDEPLRVGKGHALRIGMSRARGRYVAFMDADGDIDPKGLRPALMIVQSYEPDIVLASKRHAMSDVQYPWTRRVMSWTYHKLCRLLFRVQVRDTQTGFKIIRRSVLVTVLPRMLEKRYAFDLELLVVARMLGFTRVFEAPVRIRYRFQSQVALQSTIGIILDTLGIFYRRYILATYAATGEQRAAVVPSDDAPVLLPQALGADER